MKANLLRRWIRVIGEIENLEKDMAQYERSDETWHNAEYRKMHRRMKVLCGRKQAILDAMPETYS